MRYFMHAVNVGVFESGLDASVELQGCWWLSRGMDRGQKLFRPKLDLTCQG